MTVPVAQRDVQSAGMPDRYKWVALSNTTLGILMATLNASIVLISLPAIFRGIGLNPLTPSNVNYLLWMLQGYLVATAVLVVTFGRIGDMVGRVRIYNAGFAVFALASVALSLVFFQGRAAALTLIVLRVVQGVGGAMLMANSAAIITDAFPPHQRGFALGINGVAAIAGSFIGLIVGGLVADINWHLIFLASVPFGVFGTIWAYIRLRELAAAERTPMDWWGNLTFAAGLVAVLVGITYGIQPYGGHTMGWTSPVVIGLIVGGIAVLFLFAWIERRVRAPLFHLELFKVRAFTAGNIASLLASVGRGGLQLVLIIWLQGIWLPLHGYSFERAPLWAAIYMLPLTVGFLIAGPVSGYLSDRFGARPFATAGMLLAALSFVLLGLLPADFEYTSFALLLLLNGLAMGMFSSPNTAAIMNSVPAAQRGSASGMRATFQNAGMTLSIGIFFSLMIAGLASSLPATLQSALVGAGVPPATAGQVSALPPVATLFAAFLGYNPIATLLGPAVRHLPAGVAAQLTSTSFFPHVISEPFTTGMHATFLFAAVMMLIAAGASWLRGGPRVAVDRKPLERPAGTPSGRASAPEPAATGAVVDLVGERDRWRERAIAARPAPLVVTISAPLGAGGGVVAPAVAELLGLPFSDRLMPPALASSVPLPEIDGEGDGEGDGETAGDVDDAPIRLSRLFELYAGTDVPFGVEPPPGSSWTADDELLRVAIELRLWETAAGDGGIVLGRAGAAVLADAPHALHVLLTASPGTRRARLVDADLIAPDQAHRRLAAADSARVAYWRQGYGRDPDDLSLYHVVLDTTALPLDTCAQQIAALARVVRSAA